MNHYICLLRAVNVTGKNKIRMQDLKKLFEYHSFHQVSTYIQSGNILFCTPENDRALLVQNIESMLKKEYGVHIPIIVHTPSELEQIAHQNPFFHQEEKHLYITFLETPPDDIFMRKLKEIDTRDEQYSLMRHIVYLYLPNGYGRAKMTNTFWEKKLKTTATTRNWNTICTLIKMALEKEKN